MIPYPQPSAESLPGQPVPRAPGTGLKDEFLNIQNKQTRECYNKQKMACVHRKVVVLTEGIVKDEEKSHDGFLCFC